MNILNLVIVGVKWQIRKKKYLSKRVYFIPNIIEIEKRSPKQLIRKIYDD